MEQEFSNIKELKKRVTPALKTKLKELKSQNYTIVTLDDIWNFSINKWKKSQDLTLYDIINDILNTNNEDIEEYAIKRSEKKWQNKTKT